MSDKKDFDLNRHVARLLEGEPFFASISRRIDKKASKAVPTAGVRVNPTTAQFEMFYNPDFFESLSDIQRLGVLKHEFYHIILEHVLGRIPTDGMTKKDNISADLAINTYLTNELPEGCCMPGVGPYEWAPPGKTYEWYKANWPEDDDDEGGDKDPEKGGDNPADDGDGGSFDDHSQWGGDGSAASDTAREIARERLKEALKEAAETAARTSGWGSVSADVRRDILERIKVKVDWKKALRYFVKTSQRAEKRSTVTRINRRYPYIRAGKRINRTANIAIAIDQSGSVSDAMLVKFFSALDGLAKIASFTVVPFDTEIQEEHIYEWKKGKRHAVERVSIGGTSFECVTEYVNKNSNFDGVIVLTDMEAPKPGPCKVRRMWMTTPEYAERPYFETKEIVLVID